jgi:flagellar biosynthesis/type III secretory pathway chaperone
MTAMIDQIIETLEKSEQTYQLLLPVMRREKQAVIGSDPRNLAECVIEKEAVLAQLGTLESQRIRLIHKVADDMKVPTKRLSLSGLAERADENQRPRITRLRDSLGQLVQMVRTENQENRALIQHCLNLTRGAIGFFQHWMIPASVYGSSGRINSDQRNGKLLSGIV